MMIYVFSGEMSIRSSAYILIGLFVFFVLTCMICLYILSTVALEVKIGSLVCPWVSISLDTSKNLYIFLSPWSFVPLCGEFKGTFSLGTGQQKNSLLVLIATLLLPVNYKCMTWESVPNKRNHEDRILEIKVSYSYLVTPSFFLPYFLFLKYLNCLLCIHEPCWRYKSEEQWYFSLMSSQNSMNKETWSVNYEKPR